MSMTKRSVYAAAILLILLAYPALATGAEADFEVIRCGFDKVIEEEGGGVTYIRIHRPGHTGYDIWSARPKLGLAEGSVDANRTITITEREGRVKEVMETFFEVLPALEGSAGLQFWSIMIMWDEEPPALYIGLYKPTEAQLRAVADAMENATESRGVILRFYEALSPRSLKDELIAASDSLWERIHGGGWDQEIPIPAAGVPDPPGGLEVVVDYTKTGRTYPDDEYVTTVIKAVRGVVGYRIPIVFLFPREYGVELEAGLGIGGHWILALTLGLSLLAAGYLALRRTRSRIKTKTPQLPPFSLRTIGSTHGIFGGPRPGLFEAPIYTE